MYNFLAKNGTTIAFGVGALIVVIFLFIVFGNIDGQSVDELKETSFFDFGLYVTLFLAGATALAAVLFGIFDVATNPKGSLKGLIGIGVMVLIFIIAYNMAAPETIGNPIYETVQKFNVSEGVSKFVNAAIATTLVGLVLAVLSLVGSIIANFVK